MPRAPKLGMTLTAFAKKMGVTQGAVSQKVKNGRISEAVLPDGSLDEAKATELWAVNTAWHMKNGERRKSKTARDHADEADRDGEYKIKVRQMEIDLEVSQIKLDKLRESTIDKADARAVMRSFVREFRNNMLNFANRQGPGLAAEFGLKPGEFVGALDARIRDALIEFGNAPNPFGEDE